jgi:ubiquinone/menaquinone biosynthesis C-methylase UbiE
VLGIDLNIAEPKDSLPENCQFLKLDAENDEWPAQAFDYIHLRYVISCFDDTKAVLKKAFDHLKPGGWIELQDPEFRNITMTILSRAVLLKNGLKRLPKAARPLGEIYASRLTMNHGSKKQALSMFKTLNSSCRSTNGRKIPSLSKLVPFFKTISWDCLKASLNF